MKHAAQFKNLQKGFTLIELIIVIAIIGVLAAAVAVAIDPIDKINAANDSKVVQDTRIIYDAALRYATNNNGTIPANTSLLTSSGELKGVPNPPGGYAPSPYGYYTNSSATPPNTDAAVVTQVKSKAQYTKGSTTGGNTPPTGMTACNGTAFTGSCYFIVSNSKSCYADTAPTAYVQCP